MRMTSPSSCRFVESLEGRRLFAAPHATSIITDNRGEVVITLDKEVIPETVSGRSVQMHVPGADGVFGTADDTKVQGRVRWNAATKRITFKTDQLIANSTYSFKVSAKIVRDSEGTKLDGEFNGPGIRSGNDEAAGDLLFISKRDKTASPTARLSTSMGSIDVKLNKTAAPNTVDNYIVYANTAAWDGTFFHRNAHLSAPYNRPFVIQAGGFKVDASNELDFVAQNAAVVNEPGVSNTRGTIAMAKLSGDPDSATNQWFFNVNDNSGDPSFLDSQNGGFTVFGTITKGLEVMDAIAALTRKDLRSGNQSDPNNPTVAMDTAPVINPAATADNLNPGADLVVIRRIAIRNKVSAFVIG